MRLTFLGHAAVRLEVGEADVLIDPFLTGNPQATIGPDDVRPSHIVLTHGHGDHVGDAVALAGASDAVTIASVEVAGWLAGQGVRTTVGINLGGGVATPFGRVSLHPAWHSNSLPDGSYGGMPAGALIEAGDVRVYHAGDTALFSDLALVGRRGLDVALVPIGDHFTMGPDDAVEAVRLLAPRIVVPIHYDTFPPIRQDARAFAARVDAETDARCIVLAPGEGLDL
jgi:L-ascorbate metabolism protein UlaG (beta-lactamase superfamily)